jgi:hypothetical protein
VVIAKNKHVLVRFIKNIDEEQSSVIILNDKVTPLEVSIIEACSDDCPQWVKDAVGKKVLHTIYGSTPIASKGGLEYDKRLLPFECIQAEYEGDDETH